MKEQAKSLDERPSFLTGTDTILILHTHLAHFQTIHNDEQLHNQKSTNMFIINTPIFTAIPQFIIILKCFNSL